jgi:hypothetical protein
MIPTLFIDIKVFHFISYVIQIPVVNDVLKVAPLAIRCAVVENMHVIGAKNKKYRLH